MRHGYGVTTFNQMIGSSQVVAIGGEERVVDTCFMGATGCIIHLYGVSTAVGGSVIAGGMELQNYQVPFSVDSARVYLAAGMTAVVQIAQKISSGG